MENEKVDNPLLSVFLRNNGHCSLSVVNGEFHIDSPWGSEDCRLVFNADDEASLTHLSTIMLDPKFDAIIHRDDRLVEFIFTFLHPDDETSKGYIDRVFNFCFLNDEYKCFFREPSKELFSMARAFRRLPSEGPNVTVPQMLAFRDHQRFDRLPDSNKKYFEGKQPRSFYIQLPRNYNDIDMVRLAQHLNFIMRWYDRESPEIIIRSVTTDAAKKVKPQRYFQDSFPETISLRQIDDVILTLINVAKEAGARFSFLYYYQVIEYCGYYYLDDKIRKTLKRVLRNPSVVNCGDGSVEEIVEIFSDISHTDESKMKKVLEENCSPKVIWKEIEHDKGFFAANLSFDGGLELKSLISSDVNEQTWCTMWTPKLFDHLTRIRNGLVHAREKRETKCILPTRRNNGIIKRYIPILDRIAGELAINL